MEKLASTNPRFIPVSVANLSVGMFVAELDRPWLETPFLFQGFEITDLEELLQLENCCEYVFVDPGRSAFTLTNLPKPNVTSLTTAKRRRALKLSSAIRSKRREAAPETALKAKPVALDRETLAKQRAALCGALGSSGPENYGNKVALRRETQAAVAALDYARDAVSALVSALRHGKTLTAAHFRAAIAPVTDSILRNHDTMSWLIHIRKQDRKTFDRWISAASWCAMFGKYIGLPRPVIEDLAMGGLLMDIGTIRLSQQLREKSGEYQRREKLAVRAHVKIGVEIVRRLAGVTPRVLNMIAHHHERIDGSGYPEGILEARIPMVGRLAAIVDCYDAMISNTAYREPKSAYDALRELRSQCTGQFPTEMLEQFVQALGIFPSGTVVELNSGEIGLVMEQNAKHRLRPKVLLLLDKDKQPLAKPKPLDLTTCASAAGDTGARWIDRGHRSGEFGIDARAVFLG